MWSKTFVRTVLKRKNEKGINFLLPMMSWENLREAVNKSSWKKFTMKLKWNIFGEKITEPCCQGVRKTNTEIVYIYMFLNLYLCLDSDSCFAGWVKKSSEGERPKTGGGSSRYCLCKSVTIKTIRQQWQWQQWQWQRWQQCINDSGWKS